MSFALSGLAVAAKRLNAAIDAIETYCDSDDKANAAPLIAGAYADLLRVRGEVAAVQQLLEMQHELERAETERPSAIRLVRP